MNARKLTLTGLVSLCAVAGALLLCSAPALAAAPAIEGESFSDVGSSGVTLNATINPGGEPTVYSFEYGTSAAYGSVTQAASVGAGSEGVGVFAQLSELEPGTEYHFRVTARNASGETAQGGDETFATFNGFPSGVVGLPDGRSYELVSPLNNENGNVYLPEEEATSRERSQVSVDGSAVAYVGDPPSVGGSGKQGELIGGGNQYLATRSAGGGWTARDVYEDVAFTSELSVGVLESGDALTAGAPSGGGLYAREGGDGSYRFLAAGDAYGYAGATADGSHILLAGGGVEGAGQLYDAVEGHEGQLQDVSVLPDGDLAPKAVFGAPYEEVNFGIHRIPDFSNVISADGSRIFWSTVELIDEGDGERIYRPTALYVREDDASPGARTVQVDASQGGPPGSGGGGVFWTASSDGSKVYFTDESQLTADSTAAPGAPDLYVYDVETGRLTDLTVDANVGEHADVLGVVGAGESPEGGSYVYFAADGVLSSNENSEEEEAKPEACGPVYGEELCNLYVLHEGEQPRFIAALEPEDLLKGTARLLLGDVEPGLGARTAEVTPDGRHLAFVSLLPLTGYVNAGKNSERPLNDEIFVYDASTGGLSCASCNPSGEPPVSKEPGVYAPQSDAYTFMPRFITDDGSRVFFETEEALTQKAGGGVYEWEQDGAGSCRHSGGCVYLLVSGARVGYGKTTGFLGASGTGDDVFVVTGEQLIPGEENGDQDLYDVRVDAPQPLVAPACTSTGCQGAPAAAPVFATPASATFAGVGNFPSAPPLAVKPKPKSKPAKCKKGYVKKHGRCVKRSRDGLRMGEKSAKGRK